MHVPGYEYRRQRQRPESSGKGGFGWHQGEADAMDGHQYGCFHARHPLSVVPDEQASPTPGNPITWGVETSLSSIHG